MFRKPTKNQPPTNSEMRAIFRSKVRGWNFMTSSFYQYVYSLDDPSIISEITYGNGIFTNYLAGCTVVKVSDNGTVERHYDLSTAFADDNKFHALTKAREYAEHLTV